MFADKVIAHRGWRRRYPENTLAAIQAALAAGARGIEIDIQLSADQLPMLCHDSTLQRLCGQPLDITEACSGQLAALSAHEPERLGAQFLGTPLARLDEVVDLLAGHPEVTLYVEFKRHSLRRFGADAVLDAVLPRLQTIAGHCVLISFDLAMLGRARERGWPRLAPVLSDWQQAFAVEVADLQPELLFCDRERIPSPQALKDLPFALAIYEIDDYADALAWLAQGAAFIETFAIGELLSAAAASEPGHGR